MCRLVILLVPFEPQFYAGLPLRRCSLDTRYKLLTWMQAVRCTSAHSAQLCSADDPGLVVLLAVMRWLDAGTILIAQILTNKMPERRISL